MHLLKAVNFLVIFILALVSESIQAQDSGTGSIHEREVVLTQESPVFAKKGKAVVTQADLDAFLNRIPEPDRIPFLMSSDRIGKALDELVLSRLLAQEAIQRGALEDDAINSHLLQAVYVYLAERQTEHVWQEAKLDDYTQLAREHYKKNQEQYRQSVAADFTYLVLDTSKRKVSEAKEIADDIYEQYEQGTEFDSLVKKHSAAPDLSENNGKHRKVPRDQLDSLFATALFSLEEGEVSQPVRTDWGITLMRLDKMHEGGELIPFDEVKEEIVEVVRRKHRQRVHDRYLGRLVGQSLQLTDGAAKSLLERYDVPESEEWDTVIETLNSRSE
ncbi:peptidylprolyl isomerase [Wenzhouxiangella sp. EGI_FJ10305]|uniref:peptidylprolyl isomerase n=1 Tax=Wenzhouxiangella sp. EGI_FJ10305 TaxID=3243768 RepID=UPI0035E083F1